MPPPGSFKKQRVSAGVPTREDFTIMETVCDLVSQDVNAVIFMNNAPVPEHGWRAKTEQAFVHSRLLRFTLTAYARGKLMEEEQEARVWDLIQQRYSHGPRHSY